jgi:hypothetical protein
MSVFDAQLPSDLFLDPTRVRARFSKPAAGLVSLLAPLRFYSGRLEGCDVDRGGINKKTGLMSSSGSHFY